MVILVFVVSVAAVLLYGLASEALARASFESEVVPFLTSTLSILFATQRQPNLQKQSQNLKVLAVINEIPNISSLVNSLYDCRYRDFMAAVVELNSQLGNDRYFATHSTYLVRELRILAYTQVGVGVGSLV